LGPSQKTLPPRGASSWLRVLQASCLQQLYFCTENKHAEKSTTLKQPGQIQKRLQPIKTHY